MDAPTQAAGRNTLEKPQVDAGSDGESSPFERRSLPGLARHLYSYLFRTYSPLAAGLALIAPVVFYVAEIDQALTPATRLARAAGFLPFVCIALPILIGLMTMILLVPTWILNRFGWFDPAHAPTLLELRYGAKAGDRPHFNALFGGLIPPYSPRAAVDNSVTILGAGACGMATSCPIEA